MSGIVPYKTPNSQTWNLDKNVFHDAPGRSRLTGSKRAAYDEAVDEDIKRPKKLNLTIKNVKYYTASGSWSADKVLEPDIIKIQALFRGCLARRSVVFPSQILPSLKENVLKDLSADEQYGAAVDICRMINKITVKKILQKGMGIKPTAVAEIKSEDETLFVSRIPCLTSKEWWVGLSDDGKTVDLLFKGKELDNGAYKKVFSADDFKLDLSVVRNQSGKLYRKVDHTASVIHTLMDSYELEIDGKLHQFIHTPKSLKKNCKIIARGLSCHKTLSTISGAKIVAMPVDPLNRYATSCSLDGVNQFSLVMPRYHSTLMDMTERKYIPTDFNNPDKKHLISDRDILKVFLDVATTLKLLHDHECIHRDIKAKNIFVKLNDKDEVEGYLADFDLVTNTGDSRKEIHDYECWDKSCRKGYPLPLTDCYGLAMTFASIYVPDFHLIRREPWLLGPDTADFQLLKTIKNTIKEFAKTEGEFFNQFWAFESHPLMLISLCEVQKKCPKEQSDKIEMLKKKIILATHAFTLAYELIRQSKTVWEYLCENKNLKGSLKSSVAFKVRCEAAEKVQAETKHMTMATIKTKFEELLNTFKQTL